MPSETMTGRSEAMALVLLTLIVAADLAKDFYAVLGLTRDASDAEIKKAYRRLSLRYHPDKNREPGAKEKFLECAEAYEVLGDPARRRAYDSGGTTSSRARSGGFSEEDAKLMFDAFLDEFERMLSGDAKYGVNEVVDGLWGEKEPGRQGLFEWGAKQVFKQMARSAGGSLLRQARGISTGQSAGSDSSHHRPGDEPRHHHQGGRGAAGNDHPGGKSQSNKEQQRGSEL